MQDALSIEIDRLTDLYISEHPGPQWLSPWAKNSIMGGIRQYILTGEIRNDAELERWCNGQTIHREGIPIADPTDDQGPLAQFWTQIATAFGINNAVLSDAITSQQTDLARTLLGVYAVPPIGEEDTLGTTIVDKLEEMKLLDGESANWVRDIYNNSRTTGGALTIAILIGIAMKAIGNIGDIAGGDFYRNAMERLTPNTPTVSDLLKPLRIAGDPDGEISKRMRQNGYSDDDIQLMLLNNYEMFDQFMVRELYWRKIIDETKARHYLSQHGFTPDRIDELMQTWQVIPSAQDILWMVAKEAFEEDQVQEFGLDEEFPSDQTEWLDKQGLNSDWQHRYWRAHWSAPSIEMGYEMLHRGQLTEDQLDGLFRVQEIPRFWRERLRAISYHPYTRVDVRRMYHAGVLGRDEVYRAYRDGGYDHEHAEALTRWVEMEYADEPKQLTRAQVESGYRDGILTRNEAVKLLVQIGYGEQQADFLVDYVDFKQLDDLKDKQVEVLRVRFVNNLITEADVHAGLNRLEVSSARAQVLIETWTLDKELDVKLPSKTDIDKFLKAGVINEGIWRNYYKQLGYDAAAIDFYWRLVGSEAPVTPERGL